MHDWTLKLQGVEKPAILTIRPDTAPPEPGRALALTLEKHPKFDDKLKAKRESTGGMFGPRSEDPKRAARILRQHSQSMALTAMAQRYTPEQLREMDSTEYADKLASLMAWFDKDAEKAAE